jgi:hypothetical protein
VGSIVTLALVLLGWPLWGFAQRLARARETRGGG